MDDATEKNENRFAYYIRSKQKVVITEFADDQWYQLLEIMKHFGVKIDKDKILLNWHQLDYFSSFLFAKMLSSLITNNIIGFYNQSEGSWILMKR